MSVIFQYQSNASLTCMKIFYVTDTDATTCHQRCLFLKHRKKSMEQQFTQLKHVLDASGKKKKKKKKDDQTGVSQ